MCMPGNNALYFMRRFHALELAAWSCARQIVVGVCWSFVAATGPNEKEKKENKKKTEKKKKKNRCMTTAANQKSVANVAQDGP